MSFYLSDPKVYDIYLKDNVLLNVSNLGDIELVVAHIIDYLRNNFLSYKMSTTSAGSTPNFIYQYPEEDVLEGLLPAVVISVKEEEHYADSMGYVQNYNEESGDLARGVRVIAVVEFDIWARNNREKQALQGMIMNSLHAGIIDGGLTMRGIQAVDYIRGIPRGYDQTDRVLQGHTHQVGSDEIFRQVSEYTFTYDSRIIYDADGVGDIATVIKQIILTETTHSITSTMYENISRQGFKILIS